MATRAEWIEGARPRTLPAAIAPVAAGTAIALDADQAVWWKALLALAVALALQIGVNYANDYSDGVKGTDANRVGPLRLVGSGLATAGAVKQAAFISFGVAAACGIVLAATTAWWLLAVGAAAIVAAWYYTGGANPYGYRGLGEVAVFVFFGLVAVMGTAYVQVEEVTQGAFYAGCGVGALACAILVANNLRDIPTDIVAGKRTLAVRMGDRGSRDFFVSLHSIAVGFVLVLGKLVEPWMLLGLLALPLVVRACLTVRRGATGPALIAVLRDTGLAELVYGLGILAGAVIAQSL